MTGRRRLFEALATYMSEEKKQSEQLEERAEEAEKAYYEKRPNLGGRGPSKLREQFSRGMTSFLVIAAAILFYFALLRVSNLSSIIGTIVEVSKPIIYGLVIAYLLNPLCKQVERLLEPLLKIYFKKQKTIAKVSRTTGIMVSIVVGLALVAALCNMVIPELYKSIRDMVYTLPDQLNEGLARLNAIQISDSTTGKILNQALLEGTEALQNWLRTDLLSQTNILMSNLTSGVISIVNEVMNILIGIIVSVYVLFSKEKFSAQAKKAVYAVLEPPHANLTLHIVMKSNEIFGGFMIGKVIDSMIIGVLCYIGNAILQMPYALLVSVIVGVTNVIPFFGPYIGAIPCIILIGLADPLHGLYFAIFILLLQQLDGNVIGPKILGDSTGLSAFWVIFSILLGGGLFGFIGMVMGVPTFAVVYYIVEMLINYKLEKRNLPIQTDCYDNRSYVTDDGRYVPASEQTAEEQMTKEQITKEQDESEKTDSGKGE